MHLARRLGTRRKCGGTTGGPTQAFAELLADEDIYVLPGHVVELPGYFRISLTASDDVVERSLKGFATALERALMS